MGSWAEDLQCVRLTLCVPPQVGFLDLTDGVYVGCVRSSDRRCHGPGKYWGYDGSVYEGYFANGEKHGMGLLTEAQVNPALRKTKHHGRGRKVRMTTYRYWADDGYYYCYYYYYYYCKYYYYYCDCYYYYYYYYYNY